MDEVLSVLAAQTKAIKTLQSQMQHLDSRLSSDKGKGGINGKFPFMYPSCSHSCFAELVVVWSWCPTDTQMDAGPLNFDCELAGVPAGLDIQFEGEYEIPTVTPNVSAGWLASIFMGTNGLRFRHWRQQNRSPGSPWPLFFSPRMCEVKM